MDSVIEIPAQHCFIEEKQISQKINFIHFTVHR